MSELKSHQIIKQELATIATEKEAADLARLAEKLMSTPKFNRSRTTHKNSWTLLRARIHDTQRNGRFYWWQLALAPTILLLIGGVILSSFNSLPGDATYRIKQTIESVQVSLAISPAKRADACSVQMKRRANELARLNSQKMQTATVKNLTAAIIDEANEFNTFAKEAGSDTPRLHEQRIRDASYVIEALSSAAAHTTNSDQLKLIADTQKIMQSIVDQTS